MFMFMFIVITKLIGMCEEKLVETGWHFSYMIRLFITDCITNNNTNNKEFLQ